MGAGGRRFESSRPDQYHQGLTASAVSPFCVGVASGVVNEGVFRQVRMGYSSQSKGQVVPKTLANFLDRVTQLYEQGATVRRIGQYVRNWYRWVRAGIAQEPLPVST